MLIGFEKTNRRDLWWSRCKQPTPILMIHRFRQYAGRMILFSRVLGNCKVLHRTRRIIPKRRSQLRILPNDFLRFIQIFIPRFICLQRFEFVCRCIRNLTQIPDIVYSFLIIFIKRKSIRIISMPILYLVKKFY